LSKKIQHIVKTKNIRKIRAISWYCWKCHDEWDFLETILWFFNLRWGELFLSFEIHLKFKIIFSLSQLEQLYNHVHTWVSDTCHNSLSIEEGSLFEGSLFVLFVQLKSLRIFGKSSMSRGVCWDGFVMVRFPMQELLNIK
jgi:hypothetical protein